MRPLSVGDPGCSSQPTSGIIDAPQFRESSAINPGRPGVKILARVPRSARDVTATKLSEILNNVSSENSAKAWERLFLFSRRCLHAPARGGHRRNLTSSVIKAVREERDPAQSDSVAFKPAKDPLKNLAAHVAAKLEEGDFGGAVRIVSSNESFTPTNENTFALLSQKHPPPHSMLSMPPKPTPGSCNPAELSTSDVIKSIQSFPAGSAGGS